MNTTNNSLGRYSNGTFIALEVSLELIRALAPMVPIIERNDRDLGDQIRRAANSVALNLGEGQRSHKKNTADCTIDLSGGNSADYVPPPRLLRSTPTVVAGPDSDPYRAHGRG